MTQGRKSRTVLAIGCVLAVLAAGSVAPAFAGTPAAQTEYDFDLPGAGQGGGKSSGGGSASDDGGSGPIVLIGLAAVAAICAGVAVWRLRDRSGGPPAGKVGPGAPEAASETQ